MLNIPSTRSLPGRVQAVSFVEVGDDGFPLRNNLMKPYSLRNISSEQRVFIYHLPHAQRVAAYVLDIFTNLFWVFRSHVSLCPSKVEQIVRAAYVLHNYLATTPDATGARHNVDDSNKMPPLQRNRSSSTRSTLDS